MNKNILLIGVVLIFFATTTLMIFLTFGGDGESEVTTEATTEATTETKDEDTSTVEVSSEDVTSEEETTANTDDGMYHELSEGEVAPDFTADLIKGEGEYTLSKSAGKVVLINFWATWCPPCCGEMPAFERLQADFKDKCDIVAVNCMEDQKTVESFMDENGYTFPVALDIDGAVEVMYPTDGIPYTLVIGKDGKIRNIYLGSNGEEEQYKLYKSAIEQALEN